MSRLSIAVLLAACTELTTADTEQALILPPEVVCQLPVGATTPFPRLFAQYVDGGSLQLDAAAMTLGTDGVYRFANADATVEIRPLARGVWRMSLSNTRALSKVSWPFEHPGTGLGGNLADDRVYFPLVGGVVEREGLRVPYGWHGYRYPGESFAPIMITADPTRATILASFDAQRRSVYPMHGRAQSLLMHCPIPASGDGCATIAPGSTTSYTVLYGTVADAKTPSWFVAASHYACWHNLSSPAPVFPPEMWAEDAALTVGAQDLSDEPTAPGQADVSFVYDVRLAPYHAALGIGRVLFWGLMSPYHGGCCTDAIRIDERYDLELAETVARIKALGKKVGFYTGVHDVLGMGTSAGATWLRDWWLFDEAHGADTSFVDQLGRGSWGAEVATHLPRFSDGTIPPDAIIEGYVDAFPRAAMLSGALRMEVRTCTGGPCDPGCDTQCAFLPLSRTIMGNHIGYIGASNGDHVYMGPSASYHLERQAFLLGLKLDVSNPDVSASVLARIRELRELVGWWKYRPRYFDRSRLSSVPAGIDARLHVGSDGRCYVTVDNIPRLAGATLRVNGNSFAIAAPPADPSMPALSVIKVSATQCGS